MGRALVLVPVSGGHLWTLVDTCLWPVFFARQSSGHSGHKKNLEKALNACVRARELFYPSFVSEYQKKKKREDFKAVDTCGQVSRVSTRLLACGQRSFVLVGFLVGEAARGGRA